MYMKSQLKGKHTRGDEVREEKAEKETLTTSRDEVVGTLCSRMHVDGARAKTQFDTAGSRGRLARI